MTKMNTQSNAITSYHANEKRVTKSRAKKNDAKTNETPSILLKTIHDEIIRDNATSTLTTKQMRIWLRANMNDIHERNASWIFTSSQRDVVMTKFNTKYRATLDAQRARDERASKRATKTNASPRKRNVKSNVVLVDENNMSSNVDTNANADVNVIA